MRNVLASNPASTGPYRQRSVSDSETSSASHSPAGSAHSPSPTMASSASSLLNSMQSARQRILGQQASPTLESRLRQARRHAFDALERFKREILEHERRQSQPDGHLRREFPIIAQASWRSFPPEMITAIGDRVDSASFPRPKREELVVSDHQYIEELLEQCGDISYGTLLIAMEYFDRFQQYATNFPPGTTVKYPPPADTEQYPLGERNIFLRRTLLTCLTLAAKYTHDAHPGNSSWTDFDANASEYIQDEAAFSRGRNAVAELMESEKSVLNALNYSCRVTSAQLTRQIEVLQGHLLR